MDQHRHDDPTSIGASIGAVVGVVLAVLVGALILFLVFGAGVFDDDATPTLDDGASTEAGAGSFRPLPPPPLALDRAPAPRALTRTPSPRSAPRPRRHRRRRSGVRLAAGDTP